MKKLIAIIAWFVLIFTIAITFTACSCNRYTPGLTGENGEEQVDPNYTNGNENGVSNGSANGQNEREEDLEQILYDLARRNYILFAHVFFVRGLPYVGPVFVDTAYEVEPVVIDSDMFPTFQDLRDFITTTFVDEEANRWLYDDRGTGQPKYFEGEDGGILWNPLLDGAMGYFTNWDDMTITIRSQTENEVLFSINVTTWDGYDRENMNFIPEIIEARAVRENGVWLLYEMVH